MNGTSENFPPETIARERFILAQCVKPETLSKHAAGGGPPLFYLLL